MYFGRRTRKSKVSFIAHIRNMGVHKQNLTRPIPIKTKTIGTTLMICLARPILNQNKKNYESKFVILDRIEW
jgi:hypothetical protein